MQIKSLSAVQDRTQPEVYLQLVMSQVAWKKPIFEMRYATFLKAARTHSENVRDDFGCGSIDSVAENPALSAGNLSETPPNNQREEFAGVFTPMRRDRTTNHNPQRSNKGQAPLNRQ